MADAVLVTSLDDNPAVLAPTIADALALALAVQVIVQDLADRTAASAVKAFGYSIDTKAALPDNGSDRLFLGRLARPVVGSTGHGVTAPKSTPILRGQN
jgi:hypothetical protein